MADNLTNVTEQDEFSAGLKDYVDTFNKEELGLNDFKKALLKLQFLEKLKSEKAAGNVVVAVQLLHKEDGRKVSREYLYMLRKEDPEFARRWNIAVTLGYSHFKSEAEFKLRENVLKGDVPSIRLALSSFAKSKSMLKTGEPEIEWSEAQTQNNTQVNINISAEKRKELNNKFKQFIEAETIK